MAILTNGNRRTRDKTVWAGEAYTSGLIAARAGATSQLFIRFLDSPYSLELTPEEARKIGRQLVEMADRHARVQAANPSTPNE